MTSWFVRFWSKCHGLAGLNGFALNSSCVCIIGVFPVTPIFVGSIGSSTNFSYPVFRSVDDFLTFAEIQHNTDPQSFTVNPIPHGLLTASLFCVKLLYKDKVRMKNGESSAVASFSTSFTFSVTKFQREQFSNRSGWLEHSFGLMFTQVSFRKHLHLVIWNCTRIQ